MVGSVGSNFTIFNVGYEVLAQAVSRLALFTLFDIVPNFIIMSRTAPS